MGYESGSVTFELRILQFHTTPVCSRSRSQQLYHYVTNLYINAEPSSYSRSPLSKHDMGESHCNKKLAAHLVSVLAFIIFIGVLVINYLASEGPNGPFKFLHNTSRALSDKYHLEVTPSAWTFGLTWGTIFAWQTVWLLYSLTFLCRSDAPVLLTPAFFVLYTVANGCNVGWVFIFGVELINVAFGFLFGIQLSLYSALAVLYLRVRELEGGKLQRGDFIAVQCLVINGIALYATWVSIATLLNLAMVLTYTAGMENENSCTIALSILACEIVAWFVVDVVFLNSMTKYTLSPWLVLIVALVGSIDRNYVPGKRNSVLTLVLLCVVAVLAVIRLVVFAYTIRNQRKAVTLNKQHIRLRDSN